MTKSIEELIADKIAEAEIKKKEEELKREESENTPVEFVLSSNYKEYDLKEFIENIQSHVLEYKEHIKDLYFSFKVKNEMVASIITELFEEYKEKKEVQVYESKDVLSTIFKVPDAYCVIPHNLNIVEKMKDRKKMEDYENDSLKSYHDLLSLDIEEEKNKFKKIMVSFYDINSEQAGKFVDYCFDVVYENFKKNPHNGSDQLYSFNFLHYSFLNKENRIYNKNIGTMCDILEKNKMKNRNDLSNGVILRDALIYSDLKRIKFKDFNFKEVEYDDYSKLTKKLLDKTTGYNFPKINFFSGMNLFEFFNLYNMKERDYSEQQSIVREITNFATALYSAKYLSKIVDFSEQLKIESKEGKLYSVEEIKESLLNLLNKKEISSKNKPKI